MTEPLTLKPQSAVVSLSAAVPSALAVALAEKLQPLGHRVYQGMALVLAVDSTTETDGRAPAHPPPDPGLTLKPSAESADLTLGNLPPDLVILGPGAEALADCQSLKSRQPDLLLMWISPTEADPLRVQALQAGCSDCLSLAMPVPELAWRIHAALLQQQQRQELQQKLQQQSRVAVEYRSIFDNATEGIFQSTLEGQLINANPALAQIYGYDSPQALMASRLHVGGQRYVQPQRRAELLAYISQFGHIDEAMSEVYRQDGSRIWVSESIRQVKDEQGHPLYYEGSVQDVTDRRKMEMELRQQRFQADRLLSSILPYQIAYRLKTKPQTIAEGFDQVTVLFADLVDFSQVASQCSPKDLVRLLNDIFSCFDQLAGRYGLEKIKTIGDAYMAASGLPSPRPDHATAAARMALEMRAAIAGFHQPDGVPFRLRIGLHTGPVVAGVIGRKKFTYDLWGDTVNLASRMESTGLPDRIQVSTTLRDHLAHRFILSQRGWVTVKGKGKMLTHWLDQERPSSGLGNTPTTAQG